MYAIVIFAEEGNVLTVDASAVVVFVVSIFLVWVLSRLLFNPLNQVLDEREARTTGYRAEAKAMLAECDHKLTRYEAQMRRARAETYGILEQRRQQSLEHRAQVIEAAKQDAAGEIRQAQRNLKERVVDVKRDLAGQSLDIARRLVAGVLDRSSEEVNRAS